MPLPLRHPSPRERRHPPVESQVAPRGSSERAAASGARHRGSSLFPQSRPYGPCLRGPAGSGCPRRASAATTPSGGGSARRPAEATCDGTRAAGSRTAPRSARRGKTRAGEAAERAAEWRCASAKAEESGRGVGLAALRFEGNHLHGDVLDREKDGGDEGDGGNEDGPRLVDAPLPPGAYLEVGKGAREREW